MKHPFNNYSVKTKLIVFNLALVILTLVALAVAYIITFTSGAIKYEKQKREEQTVTIAKSVEDLIQSAYIVSGNVEINNDIINVIGNYKESDEQKVKTIAKQIIAVNAREIKDLTIYLETTRFSSSGYIVTLDSISSLNEYEWGEYFLSSGKNVVLCAWNNGKENILSIVRYTFLEEIEDVCVCRIDINTETIKSLFNGSIIVDEGGYISLNYNGNEVLKRGSIEKGSYLYEFEYKSYKMLEDFTLETQIPEAVLWQAPIKLIVTLGCITLITVIGLVIFLLYVITPINVRLKSLQTAMVATAQNVYKPIQIEESKDEIGQSITAYNQMINTINEMFERIYNDAISKAKLESDVLKSKYISLKSQIDPHFIYNVLNSIYSKSIIKGEDETAKVILTFSKMLRENLLWSKDMVTIEEEIENVDRFILIQKYRYDDAFEYDFDYQKDLYDLNIPKMTILTLVENSFKYVVGNSDYIVTLKVKCEKIGEDYVISAFDNGKTLTQDEVNEIYQRVLKEDKGDDDPKGISNVISRIKYYYDDVRFKIEITESGNEFIIKFKKRNNETVNS